MLSNAYFLAKFRFDTAENEPAKNLQKFANNFANVFHAQEEAADEELARLQARAEKLLKEAEQILQA